jgi:hypothetical protein
MAFICFFFRREKFLRVGLFSGLWERSSVHRDAAVLNHSVLHMSEEWRRDVLTVGIENHLAGDTFVRFCSGQSVTDASFV